VYCRYCTTIGQSNLFCFHREPTRSVDVPTCSNEAYELKTQAGKGGRVATRGGARQREEEYEYEDVVVSRRPPAQPVTTGEDGYKNIP